MSPRQGEEEAEKRFFQALDAGDVLEDTFTYAIREGAAPPVLGGGVPVGELTRS